jgi:hypothetical protein
MTFPSLSFSSEPIRSNKSLRPTATRCTFTFFMIKTVQRLSASLPVAATELFSR